MRIVLALAALTLMGGCHAQTYPYHSGYYRQRAHYRPAPSVYVAPAPQVYVPPPSYVVPPPPPHHPLWR